MLINCLFLGIILIEIKTNAKQRIAFKKTFMEKSSITESILIKRVTATKVRNGSYGWIELSFFIKYSPSLLINYYLYTCLFHYNLLL